MDLRTALDIILRNSYAVRKFKLLVVLFALVSLSGCVGTRFLETNQSLVIKEPEMSGVSGKLEDDLLDLSVQKPNQRLLGFLPFSHLVYVYEFGQARFDTSSYQARIDKTTSKYTRRIANTSKQSKINRLTQKQNSKIDELEFKKNNGNWLMQIGEPLAIYDSTKTTNSVRNFQNYLISNGYFNNRISTSKIDRTSDKTFIKYEFNTGDRFIIDSIVYDFPSQEIVQLLASQKSSEKLTSGQGYSQKSLENERNFIYQTLTNNGYFTFSRQFVTFEIDTFSIPGSRILLIEKILSPANGSHKPFTIDSIQFFSTSGQTTIKSTSEYTNGVKFLFGDRKYPTDILNDRIYIHKDSLYSRDNAVKTQQQLSYLDAFKFVNINYDSTSNQKLLANIFTSPLNKYQSSLEVGGISIESQQIPGPFINLGLKNRNAFKSMEVMDLQGNFSLLGISNIQSGSRDYTLFQYGASAGITFPKFIFFNSDNALSRVGPVNPQSRLQLAYNYENRTKEYERSSTELSFSYLWRREDRSRFNLTPMAFSFVDVQYLNPDFEVFLNKQDSLGNGSLRAAFNSSVINSSSIEALYNFAPTNSIGGDNSFLRIFGESGGNIVNFIGEDFALWSRESFADTLSFFRWAKINFDYREVHRINSKSRLAYRFNFGFAYPYGKNPALPYLKRFYIGGSNSLRAWQVRRLGPGALSDLNDEQNQTDHTIDIVNYQLEKGGDMVIEASVELRKKLIGFVDYALFIDAGNIWLVNSTSNQMDEEGDDGFFRLDSFYKEIAIGAGIGLRLDFSFFVFRLDGAVQIHDPAQLRGNRWVLDDVLRLRDRDVLSNKTNLTLGIGLPF
jgi:outer membrane protein insertion porin family